MLDVILCSNMHVQLPRGTRARPWGFKTFISSSTQPGKYFNCSKKLKCCKTLRIVDIHFNIYEYEKLSWVSKSHKLAQLLYPIYAESIFLSLSTGRVHFQFLGCWVVFFIFIPFNRAFCKQILKILIRRLALRRLIWTCTVYRCPIKRTPGLNGLREQIYSQST